MRRHSQAFLPTCEAAEHGCVLDQCDSGKDCSTDSNSNENDNKSSKNNKNNSDNNNSNNEKIVIIKMEIQNENNIKNNNNNKDISKRMAQRKRIRTIKIPK